MGKRRVGLAVTDPARQIVRALPTLERNRIRDDIQKLKITAENWHASELLVGRPLHMSGDPSRQSEYTEEFADRLSKHSGLPVVYWDERLSSAHAERLMREAGRPIVRKEGVVDQIAALLLLESYLDFLKLNDET